MDKKSISINNLIKAIEVEEHTYKRLFTVLDEIAYSKKRDITIDDVINELIDTYQENNWTHFGAGAGGG